MASQTLQTLITINARTDGFAAVGATLTELGSLVNGMSQQLIDFGKESLDVYKTYEQNMAEAEVALSTRYGRNTQALADTMEQLNTSATEWAASTIFHTNDVAGAINQAAHAGWDLDQILTGIPAAMELAQAGGIDLTDSLYYITEFTKSFGLPFEEIGEFVDMWVFAANSSNGNVEQFGDSMLKLGATMRFTDSKEELLALIGLMHDMGESGSTAATLLRTSMMRILAPSGTAGSVLEALGATQEEIDAIREDASKIEALNLLESYGFSAFDETTHQAKPIIDIYAELGEVLAQIAGGYDNITKNETTLGVLGTIFGTRGITGALDIVTALQSAVDIRDKLLAGEATGYGEYASATMMDTLYGKTETFESKIERLKQLVGEELSTQVESVYGSIGGIVDKIAELPEGQLGALTAGLEVIAAAGPGALFAGTAIRVIANALTPAGGIFLAAMALTAGAVALNRLKEADFENTFGTMNINMAEISASLSEVSGDIAGTLGNFSDFGNAAKEAADNYKDAGATLTNNLWSKMVTGVELTEDDIEKLKSQGETFITELKNGIDAGAAEKLELAALIFGVDTDDLLDENGLPKETNPMLQSLATLIQAGYDDAIAKANKKSKELRDAMTSAFLDGQLTEAEMENIQKIMAEINEIMAGINAIIQTGEERQYGNLILVKGVVL